VTSGTCSRRKASISGDVRDPGHHEEGLPAAIVLAQQRLAHGDRVELTDIGADGEPVDGRRADDAEVPHARHRHLQRARDRRGRKRQDMHVRAHLLQAFLVADAEALFLVDHKKAQVLEPDALGQQRMGADDDVDGAVGQPFLVSVATFAGRSATAAGH
jgi:hypothetical protein